MRLDSKEQLDTFRQRDIHVYHHGETYFVLRERRNNVVCSSKSSLGKATVGSWCTEKRGEIYSVKKATFYILSLEKSY